MKKIHKISLLGIIILASLLRFVDLNHLPISLFGDEVDIGYQAYSILETGKDYLGNSFPVYFQSLTEWRMPALVYASVPMVYLFGLTPFAIRILPALFGVINIIQIFLFARLLFQENKISGNLIGLLSAFVLAITPWHIHFSRAGFDVTFQIFVILLGLSLLIRSAGKNILFFVSLSILALSVYVYPTSVIFTPLITLALIIIYRILPDFSKKIQILILLIPLLLVISPFIINYLSGVSSNRFSGINIFSDQKIIDRVITTRTEPWVSGNPVEKYFHNKPFAFASAFISNYLKSFSTQFLFLTGDPNYRHSISNYGQLLWVTAPFLFIGLATLINSLKKPRNQFILLWLLLSPITAATTVDGGTHATRLFVMLAPLVIITALGVEIVINKFPPKVGVAVLSLFLGLFLFNLSDYWHNYTSHYRYSSASIWHYGYSDIFHQLSKIDTNGSVYINNTVEPSLVHFAFHTKFPPDQFQRILKENETKSYAISGFDGFSFGGKYYFGEIEKATSLNELLKPGDIYLAAQLKEVPGDWDWRKSAPAGLKVVGSTADVYQKPLFYLVTKDSE